MRQETDSAEQPENEANVRSQIGRHEGAIS